MFSLSSYPVDEKELQRGTRQKIIGNALSGFGIEDREGELLLRISDDRYGDALYSFTQAVLKISDVTFLVRTREIHVYGRLPSVPYGPRRGG